MSKNPVEFTTGALFCKNCGMMLHLDSKCTHSVMCKFCSHSSELSKLTGQEVVHKKEFS